MALVTAPFMVSSAAGQAGPRAVLELFTSQGCASCPAADELAGELARDPSLIVLTLPVPYWDYLGWKDTLAQKAHTRRQRAYAAARGDRQVYTPQVIVNGLAHVLGSDREAIKRTIGETGAGSPLALAVTIHATGDAVTVELPGQSGEKRQAVVWLCPMSRAVPVKIGRGENRGRTVTYTNVVRRWIKLGTWTGEPATFSLPRSAWDNGDVDAVAVLVQHTPQEAPQMLMGAAMKPLP